MLLLLTESNTHTDEAAARYQPQRQKPPQRIAMFNIKLLFRCQKNLLTLACVLPLQIATETAGHDGELGDDGNGEEGV